MSDLTLNLSLLPTDTSLCAAVSGGADSMVMLDMIWRAGHNVTVLHCNFGLRGKESDEDEAFVRDWCREREIPLRVIRFDTPGISHTTGESIEMTARRLRYDWFCEVAAEVCPTRPAVAVAHHADDQVETLLLNLLRGTGIHGMTGMKARNSYTSTTGRQIDVLRPLLGVSRREILAYAEAHHIEYRTDSTNADTAMRRNFLRHRVIPLLRELQPAADALLTQAMSHLADAETLIELAVEEVRRTACSYPAPRTATRLRGITEKDMLVSAAALGHLSDQQRRAALYELLSPYGFDGEVVSRLAKARTGAVFSATDYDLCVTATGFHVGQRAGDFCPQRLYLDKGADNHGLRLEVRPMDSTLPSPASLGPDTAMLDADCVDAGTLTLSAVDAGTRFAPFGMRQGTRLVSDYLTDRHRSRIDKQRALAVSDARGLLWLVGETIDQRAAVTTDTRRVIIISAYAG